MREKLFQGEIVEPVPAGAIRIRVSSEGRGPRTMTVDVAPRSMTTVVVED